jgi:hypothetical protein
LAISSLSGPDDYAGTSIGFLVLELVFKDLYSKSARTQPQYREIGGISGRDRGRRTVSLLLGTC